MVCFFQAEDGIRDYKVTGVQTCALPISSSATGLRSPPGGVSTPRSSGPRPVACSSRRSCSTAACRRSRSGTRSEEHTSELQSPCNLVCRLLLEKKKYHRLCSYAYVKGVG